MTDEESCQGCRDVTKHQNLPSVITTGNFRSFRIPRAIASKPAVAKQ
ncbi:hypothetical protein QUA62_23635 [Microcoleus sp. MON1_C1]